MVEDSDFSFCRNFYRTLLFQMYAIQKEAYLSLNGSF